LPSSQANFIANVRALLAENGWEVQTLADRANMPGPQVSKYLSKTTVPGLAQIERIAAAFGRTVPEMLSPNLKVPEREIEHPIEVCVSRVSAAALASHAPRSSAAEVEPEKPQASAPASSQPAEGPTLPELVHTIRMAMQYDPLVLARVKQEIEDIEKSSPRREPVSGTPSKVKKT